MKIHTLWLVLFLAIITNACKEEKSDPCDGKICGPNETCVEGICRCPENYTGVGCKDQKTPSSIDIMSVKILRFPARTVNNSPWDTDGAPDIYFTIYESANKIGSSSSTINNATNSSYIVPLSGPISIEDVEKRYTLTIYDDDGNKTDEFMSGVVSAIYNNTNNFPSTITVDSGGIVAFELEVTYNF